MVCLLFVQNELRDLPDGYCLALISQRESSKLRVVGELFDTDLLTSTCNLQSSDNVLPLGCERRWLLAFTAGLGLEACVIMLQMSPLL